MGRNQLYLEPPPLLLPAPGLCQFHKVINNGSQWRCARPSGRVIQIGLDHPVDVCLLHSLIATERMNAYLLRDHPTREPGKG